MKQTKAPSRTFQAVFLALFASALSFGQTPNYYFFRPVDYGSDALFNPVSLLANGGFDTYQIINDRGPTIDATYWNRSGTNIWRSITSPGDVVHRFGTARFFRQEIFPTSLDIDNAQYVPNFMLHTIGGGMAFRKISEWYEFHEVPAPYIVGAVTSVAFEYINEMVENGPGIYPNEDCIPDMLVFQPLGILLFSSDGISEFFSGTLELNDWSQPVAVTFNPFAIRNAGQNFVMKLGLNRNRTTSLFFHFGDFAVFGLSFKTNREETVSFGAGVASTGRKSLPPQNGVPSNTIVTGGMAGIYYDRNNSLMFSMVYSDVENNRFRLNLYPGVIQSSFFSPGLFVTVARHGTLIAGLTARILPLGIGAYSPH